MKRKKNKQPRTVQAGGLNCMVVKLLGGPYDGCETLSSHGSAWHEGEYYCKVEFTDDPPDVLRHAKTWLSANTPEGEKQIVSERAKVEAWMAASHKEALAGRMPIPIAVLIPMGADRIGVHYSMIRSGAEL